MKILNPCKKCLVKASCFKTCYIKGDYNITRDGLSLIIPVFLGILSIILVGVMVFKGLHII